MSDLDISKINHVEIKQDRVIKVFAHGKKSAIRFNREVTALKRLAYIEGIPSLFSYSPTHRCIAIERIPGTPLSLADHIPDQFFAQLRVLIENLLLCGVARHSLPARDVIVQPDGSVGLVDFERCSFRHFVGDPMWWVASKVAHFNLLRLIDSYAPVQLTYDEQHMLYRQYKWQNRYRNIRQWLQR
ncbi:MAG: hypothetical protein ACTH1W_01895 [Advenella sp.]|uniref:hypothetical protein n=1 Tax=Advenella sp. S44 TaxID=1982755 RepID=UPI00128FD0FA|nr:hypothetical protein [Advenella sp. S44]